MTNFFVLVDKIDDWKPYFPTDQLILANDYLFSKSYQEMKSTRVLNLCQDTSYLSMGYYCSLLAEARSHKIMPAVKVINDLSKKGFYLYDLEEFDEQIKEIAPKIIQKDIDVKSFSFKIFFGEVENKLLKSIGRQIFEQYPCPILEVKISFKSFWKVDTVIQVGLKSLTDTDQTVFAKALEKFSTKIWRTPKSSKTYRYDLAILVDPEEAMAPSDEHALKAFAKACKEQSVYCETITKRDLSRLSEFDALFIRQTTSITNITYKFSKKAKAEGLVVIDDPDSILKCTNKIFLANLFERNNVPIIPGHFVSDHKEKTLIMLEETLSYPMVLKVPDGSFSIGVKKAKDRTELLALLKDFLKKSSLVMVQKFFYTDYDWRIGIIGKKPIFACKYYMSKGHWQIYNHSTEKTNDDFSGNFETMRIEDAPSYVVKTALKAANLIGDSLYGVDLKDDGSKAYVVEVNDNPNIDLNVEDKVLGEELYNLVIKEFVTRIEKQKNGSN